VEAFFTEINPGFPVVDESEFQLSYKDKESAPPLLLFQAVLLAGAHACQHPKVVESRAHVKAVLFQRAKTLWDLRLENDRVTLG
jgi:transcriptional regulatory protein AMDR